MVHKNSESSLGMDVQSKQQLHHLLKNLHELVVSKFNKAFYRGDGIHRYQDRLCVLDVDDLVGLILDEAHGFDIQLILVLPKCIVICKRSMVEWVYEGYNGICGQMFEL